MNPYPSSCILFSIKTENVCLVLVNDLDIPCAGITEF